MAKIRGPHYEAQRRRLAHNIPLAGYCYQIPGRQSQLQGARLTGTPRFSTKIHVLQFLRHRSVANGWGVDWLVDRGVMVVWLTGRSIVWSIG